MAAGSAFWEDLSVAMKRNAGKLLEYVSNGVVICACLAAALLYARGQMGNKDELNRGSSLPRIGALKWSTPRTVVLFLSTKCEFCKASSPFYRTLLEEQRSRSSTVDIVAVFQEGPEVVSRFMGSEQLDMKSVPDIDVKSLHVKGTPTVVVVDGGGKILDAWSGRLGKDRQQQVRKAAFGPNM